MFKIIYEFNIIHLPKSHWTKTFFAQQIPYPVKTYLIFKIFRINHNKDKIQKTKVKSKKAISNNHKDRKGLTQRGPSVKGPTVKKLALWLILGRGQNERWPW
jgi:hypothetical protein